MRWIPLAAVAAAAFTFLITLGGTAAAAPSSQGSGCIAHHPNYIEGVFEVGYAAV